ITGTVTWQHAEIDDFAIYRQDGTPIYNFGAAVDDAFMQISHVIRGLDIQSSTPRQIMVLRALGLPVPVYAHVPLVMGEGGRKLSKRYGGGSVEWYRDHGFLPDAVVNWMVLLGTGYGDETILSRDEMIAGFDLSKVNASAAAFDLEKLDWMNGEYIRMIPDPVLQEAVVPWLASQGLVSVPTTYEEAAGLAALVPLAKTRIKRLEEVSRYMRPVLDGIDMDPAAFEKVMRQEHVADQLTRSVDKLEALGRWDRDAIEAALREIQTEMGLKPKTAFAPFYVSVTGSTVSLPIFDVMALVGREECLRRIKEALRALTG
ncbi:MAG: glutamate--tRNA ligase, partial [Actinomycetota bacterium]